ncbi:hypothetical protein Tcan_13268 [Toxocara canis]|uniref:Uncharacterized protein n=1 Tax=Toxocara canis TaxID=6265 RepID=A0A0B2VPQ9_TOXCA|nr:hypothetical protein Tcan_13268 [Toxocara canis]
MIQGRQIRKTNVLMLVRIDKSSVNVLKASVKYEGAFPGELIYMIDAFCTNNHSISGTIPLDAVNPCDAYQVDVNYTAMIQGRQIRKTNVLMLVRIDKSSVNVLKASVKYEGAFPGELIYMIDAFCTNNHSIRCSTYQAYCGLAVSDGICQLYFSYFFDGATKSTAFSIYKLNDTLSSNFQHPLTSNECLSFGAESSIESITLNNDNVGIVLERVKNLLMTSVVTAQDIYYLSLIIYNGTRVSNLTNQEFITVSEIMDTILALPEDLFHRSNSGALNSTNRFLQSLPNLFRNAPARAEYMNGSLIALVGWDVDCKSEIDEDDQVEGIADDGQSFKLFTAEDADDLDIDDGASISVPHDVICRSQASKSFFVVYRNPNLFVGNEADRTSHDDRRNEIADGCMVGQFLTDRRVLSATLLSNNSVVSQLIVDGVNQTMAILRYGKKKNGMTTDPALCNDILVSLGFTIGTASVISLAILTLFYLCKLYHRGRLCVAFAFVLQYQPRGVDDTLGILYITGLLLFFIMFTYFTDQNLVGTNCAVVAGMTYTTFLTSMIMTTFQSLKVLSSFVPSVYLEGFLRRASNIFAACFIGIEANDFVAISADAKLTHTKSVQRLKIVTLLLVQFTLGVPWNLGENAEVSTKSIYEAVKMASEDASVKVICSETVLNYMAQADKFCMDGWNQQFCYVLIA